MQLRRLTQLEGKKLRDELEELQDDHQGARVDPRRASRSSAAVIKDELLELQRKYADERRTKLTADVGEIDVLDLIHDEEVVVVLTSKGYIKTVAADAFRRQSRGGKGVRGSRSRDDDYVDKLLTTTAHSYLLLFSNRGKVYRLRAHEIPMKERTARGTALVNLITLAQDERIQAIIDTRTYEEGAFLFFATKNGMVKKTRMTEYDTSHRSGLIAINLARERRARARHPDDRRQRRRHGHPQRADDPLLRGRRAPHGPGDGGGPRHEAQVRRRGRGVRRRTDAVPSCSSSAPAATGSARSSTCSTSRAEADRASAG